MSSKCLELGFWLCSSGDVLGLGNGTAICLFEGGQLPVTSLLLWY